MQAPSKILIAFLALVAGAGCASESGSSGNAAVPTPPGIQCPAPCLPAPTPSPTPAYGGPTAPITLTSTAALARMFPDFNPNNPQNVTITVNLANTRESVIVSYTDGGTTDRAALGTVHPYSGHSDASFNKWYTDPTSNKQVWKGFFQDAKGAVILIVDKFLSQGDGQIGNVLGGSIWFQNFNRYYPNNPQQGPLKMCWQIEMGPYDCRTWITAGGVNPISSYYPNNRGPDANMNYEKLGDFNGIAKDASGF